MALIYADATSTSHAKVKTNVTVKALAQKQSCAAICKQKNDALIADDIVEGICYGFGIQSAEICVAVNDQTKTSLTGKKIKNF